MRRLLLALLLAPVAGLAQDLSPLSPDANSPVPPCRSAMDGQVMCRFGVIYACEFVSPDAMESRTGWRWRSDILRGGCRIPSAPADMAGDRRASEPPSLTYAPQISGPATQSGQSGTPTGPGYRRSWQRD